MGKKEVLIFSIISLLILLVIGFVNATVTISSPVNGTNTRDRTVTLIVSTNEPGVSLLYSVNNGRFRLFCSDCGIDIDNSRSVSLKNGVNTIKIKEGIDSLKEVEINVDPRAPVINNILPENKKYSNGVFQVYFREDNFDKASLFYRLPTDPDFTETIAGCSNTIIDMWNCTASPSLLIDGDNVLFAFGISDKIGTTFSNTFTTIIDKTDPDVSIISPEDGAEVGRRFLLQIGTNEKTTISYDIDYNGRFKKLCSNCNYVESTVSLKKGEHTIIVNAIDNAGNLGTDSIDVEVI